MVEIKSVTFEHHRESNAINHVKLGIGESSPRLSWKFSGNDKNWTQTSYDIEIWRVVVPNVTPLVVQAFHVDSSQSVLVPWPMDALQSRETVRVKVRATGPAGSEPTPWSNEIFATAGLLHRSDWTAQMIAGERTLSSNNSLRPMRFRKTFKVGDFPAVRDVRLYITSYGVYEAHINGKRVGEHVLAPGWTSYKHHLNYQTFQVRPQLREGENVIAVEVAEGWYCGRLGFGGGERCIYGDRIALLAQLEIEYQDGERVIIASDNSWKSSVSPILSSELYDGEAYDATLDAPGWSSRSFDDKKWTSAQRIDFPTANLNSPNGPPVRGIGYLKPCNILLSPTNKIIVDFGQNLVGRVRVKVRGPKGHKIVFKHAEVLERGELAIRPLRICKAVDNLILGGEEIEWEPKFTFHGFRYVQVDNWPTNGGTPRLEDIKAIILHTNMEETGSFECSEEMVNKLHHNIRWGMKGNFLSIPTDCPQRDERLGWTGDIQIFSPTANFLYNTTGMLSGWLKDLAVETIEDDPKGVVPLVVPNVIPVKFTAPEAAWADASIIVPWDLYKASGDSNILANQYESMKTWIEKGIPRQSNGLWSPELHQLGDWLDPAAPPSQPGNGKTDPHLVANAYLVRITELMADISKVLKLKEDEQHYSKEASRLKSLFQAEYMTQNGRLAPDTMTSLALGLSLNLFPTAAQTQYAAKRLSRIVRSSKFRIATGFVGTPLICPALTMSGQTQLAYRMLLERKCPSWLYPITMGATTMWERWDSMLPDGSINPGEMTSFNHYALGSVGAWLHSTVGGISPAKAGWKVVRFEPIPGGTITWAKVGYESPYGKVACEWKIEDGRLKMSALVPPNSRGEVKLPESDVVISVGSGRHEYDFEYTAPEWPPMAIENPFEHEED
jgi:alpha-L-rhamnosidase